MWAGSRWSWGWWGARSRQQKSRERFQGGLGCKPHSAVTKVTAPVPRLCSLQYSRCRWIPDPPALSLLWRAHPRTALLESTFSREAEGKSNPALCLISALCSVEPSVWVRFVKLVDFSLRLYPIQTPDTAVHQTPRICYAPPVCLVLREYPWERRRGSSWWPAREEGQDGIPEELGLGEWGWARGGLQAGPRVPE